MLLYGSCVAHTNPAEIGSAPYDAGAAQIGLMYGNNIILVINPIYRACSREAADIQASRRDFISSLRGGKYRRIGRQFKQACI